MMATRDPDDPRRVWPAFLAVAAVGTLPYIELWATNHESFAPRPLVGWWALTVGGLLGSVAIAYWLGGRSGARRTSTFLVPLVWLFFHQPVVADLLGTLGIRDGDDVFAWVAAAALVAAPLVLLSRHRVAQVYMAMLAVLALAPPLVDVLMRPSGGTIQTTVPSEAQDAPPLRRTPNVYFLLPDGYARADVMQAQFGLDISPFLGGLEQRGFQVQDEAVANYPTTFASAASTLSMTYMLDETGSVGDLDRFYSTIKGDNAVVDRFRAAGYRYAHAYTWDSIACAGYEDVCIGALGPIDEASSALLRSTPVAPLVEELTNPLDNLRRYSNPVTVVQELAATRQDRPVFLFAHLLAPHPPFVWHADCSPREASYDITFWHTDQRAGFSGAVECLNTLLLRAVDLIVAADPDAVIVIQADHGVAFGLDWGRMGPMDVGQRLPVLSALRLPDSCRHTAPTDLTPVNTFRIVFACLDGTDAELLEDRHYWGQYGYETFAAIEDELIAPLKTSDGPS